MADKKSELNLNTKTHSIYSVVSFVLSLISLILFVVAVILSASYTKQGVSYPLFLGLMVIVGMICNVSGTIFGIIGEVIKDYFKLFSHMGLVIHCVMLFAHGYVLIFGY